MHEKFIKIFFVFWLLPLLGYSQFFFLEDAHEQVEVEFLRKKIETNSKESFFNVLKISNPSNRTVSFQTNFSYPANWTFIGDKNQQISLNAKDSILIPIRVSASIDAKGEIGYAVVASLSDLKGNKFKSEYSFVNIPKITKVKFAPKNRWIHFEQNKKKSELQLYFSNQGNTDEIFFIDYSFAESLTTTGSYGGFYKDEVILRPYSDTIVTLPLELRPNKTIESGSAQRIKIKAYTADTVFNTSIWAKKLDNSYYNTVSSNYTLLSVELSSLNLFSDGEPYQNFHFYGNVLLKKAGNITYDFQLYGKKQIGTFFNQGRYNIKYDYKNLKLEVGDIPKVMVQSLHGRGGYFEYLYNKKYIGKFMASKTNNLDKTNIGGSITFPIKKQSIEIGGSYVDNNYSSTKSTAAFISPSLTFGKNGKLLTQIATTVANWDYSTNSPTVGFGGLFFYTQTINKLSMRLNAQIGDRNFFGYYRGRKQAGVNIKRQLNSKAAVNLYYNLSDNNPPIYSHDTLLSGNRSKVDELRLTYDFFTSPKQFISMGPETDSYFGNSFIGSSENQNFATRNLMGFFTYRYRDRLKGNTFTLTGKAGYNIVTNYNESIIIDTGLNKNWFSMIISPSFRSRIWGINVAYYHGPYIIQQQYNYFANNNTSKNIRVSPYLDVFLYPKTIRLVIRPSYMHEPITKVTRVNMTTDLIGYFGRTWELKFSNSLSYSANIDAITDEKFTYMNNYFEFRIKKDFLIKQPRYQYHKINLNFFKDLNGNLVKDDNEPGVQNVLVTVEKDENPDLLEKFSTAGFFMPTDLLSDIDGAVSYTNIPNGYYTLRYKAIGKMEGSFSSEDSEKHIYVGKNEKLYIPFSENNKIFGSVILNRSKLSNLGSLDISNIKVTAEDSQGRKHSTLTDAKGNFNIYVPSVDKYTVKVNNIFFENFDIEQNSYQVQLNGYRQFEVNFIFNEKKRKINFTSSYEYGSQLDGPGIEIVRRTNLSGKIKDATTLKPIVAQIRIVDDRGKEISSTKSSLKTGIFTTSFIAGNDYSVEISADEYWYHAEKLYSQQIVTFKNLKKEILLKGITVGQFIPMNTLKYSPGEYDIPAIAFPELERLLTVLKKNPSVKISIHGHSDDLEILDSESDLALERAKLIAKFLIANGYNRVKYIGHSNTKPIANNDTEDGRRQNRRVEIIVTGK